MSGTGQSRHFDPQPATSGLPRSTDIARAAGLVRLVPPRKVGACGIRRLAGFARGTASNRRVSSEWTKFIQPVCRFAEVNPLPILDRTISFWHRRPAVQHHDLRRLGSCDLLLAPNRSFACFNGSDVRCGSSCKVKRSPSTGAPPLDGFTLRLLCGAGRQR
jgi:hypothetical protein